MVSLDAEWDVHKNAHGRIVGNGTVALVQLGYTDADGVHCAILLPVSTSKGLPGALVSLFKHNKFTFVGSCVTADLAMIGKDFNQGSVTSKVKAVNLGKFARCRDIVKIGTAGLAKLVEICFGECTSKDPSVRCSRWSRVELSPDQVITFFELSCCGCATDPLSTVSTLQALLHACIGCTIAIDNM